MKMDFTPKDRWLLDGHKTMLPIESVHVGVTLKESTRIVLTHEAVNELESFAGGIKNSCLQDPISEKHYLMCGN